MEIHTNPSKVLATLLVGYVRQINLQDGSPTGSHEILIEDYDGDLHKGTIPKKFIKPDEVEKVIGSEVILARRHAEVLMPDGDWCFWDSLDTICFLSGPFQGKHHIAGTNSDKQTMTSQRII